jgi:hypothetical protein
VGNSTLGLATEQGFRALLCTLALAVQAASFITSIAGPSHFWNPTGATCVHGLFWALWLLARQSRFQVSELRSGAGVVAWWQQRCSVVQLGASFPLLCVVSVCYCSSQPTYAEGAVSGRSLPVLGRFSCLLQAVSASVLSFCTALVAIPRCLGTFHLTMLPFIKGSSLAIAPALHAKPEVGICGAAHVALPGFCGFKHTCCCWSTVQGQYSQMARCHMARRRYRLARCGRAYNCDSTDDERAVQSH